LARLKKPSGRKIVSSRSISDLKRTRGFRTPSKVLVLVCEGKKTEPIYFNALRTKLRISSLNILLIPGQGAPISIVERAIEEKKCISKGDEVWCVFDVERIGYNPTFSEAVSKARRAKLHLAISNPAFEYWFLLHFERTDHPFKDANEVLGQLHQHLPHYQKNINIYDDIKSSTRTAITNARELRRCSADNWSGFPNSSTGVDKLVCEIYKLIE